MRFPSISIYLIAFCLASLAGNSFGELFMIRHTPQKTGDPYKLTCVSKDLHAAFVWNDDLRSPVQPKNTVPMQPQITENCTSPGRNYSVVTGKKNSEWRVVNSATDPMSPVFDSRWEDFCQLSFPRDDFENEYQYVRNVPKSGTLVFSARGLGDINIRLCEKSKFVSGNSCFWITIPALPNTKCVIRSCLRGKTEDGKLSRDSCIVENLVGELSSQSVIDASEWRTFILKWDTDYSQLKSYSGVNFDFKKHFKKSKNVNHLFVQSSAAGHIRFHFYDYFLTRTKDAVLSFVTFVYTDSNYCRELLVSLCIECKLQVHAVITSDLVVRDKSRKIIGSISGAKNFVDGELATWQIVKLDPIPKKFYGHNVTLEIIPILETNCTGCWWAIDSLPKCRPVGQIRTCTRTFDELSNQTSTALPIVGCQQLSYSRNVVVSSNASITQKIPTNCTSGQVGPACVFNCTNSCKGTSICDQSDCICAPGFVGSNCSTECADGRHGYNCQNTCGSCKSGNCDKMNGICDSDCKDYYLPPYCKTEVKAPGVSNVTTTSAILHYPNLDTESAEKISIDIKTKKVPWATSVTKLTSGTRWETQVRDLLPGTLYILRAVVTTRGGVVVNSPETNFTTMCKPQIIPEDLRVNYTGNGLVQLTQYHPSDFGWSVTAFRVLVETVSTRRRNGQRLNLTGPELYPVQHGPSYFYVTLYLSTATTYYFRVRAISSCGSSEWVNGILRVPASLGFANKEKLQVKPNASSIILKLPSVINDTEDSVMTVVVKGHHSPTCTSSPVPDDLRRRVNMTKFEDGWIAAIYDNPESRPENFTIGKYPNDDNSKKCFLDPEQTYVFLIDVIDQVDFKPAVITSLPIYMTTIEAGKSNLVWLILPLILLFCLFSLFIWRRKFSNALTQVDWKNVVSWCPIFTNFFKSTTTCTSQQIPTLRLSEEVELSENINTSDHVSWNHYSHSVNIKDFGDYVKASIASGLLESQFQMFPRGRNKPCQYGALPENKLKNRHNDIIAYDNSRVVLKKTPDDPYSDYINANYIQGFRKERAYIATEGPKSNTIADFWKMIWQEEVRVICMLTNVVEDGEKLCEQYWPKVESTVKYGHIAILNVDQRVFADFIYRTFQLTTHRKAESRKVYENQVLSLFLLQFGYWRLSAPYATQVEHLQYTSWPKTGVPMYSHSIVEYLNELRSIDPGPGPIVVHCSAGNGRTGTIILCDICLNYTSAEGTVNLFAEAQKMYDARANMLDNLQQYILAHLMPTQCLLLLPTKLPCSDVSRVKIEELKMDLPTHIKRLEDSTWKDKALCSSEPLRLPNPEHLVKNRFPKFTPVERSLVRLKRYPIHDSGSDYISAISVNGVRVEKQYLASQLPLPSTLSDFWRLVAEQKVELIVILQRPTAEDLSCVDIIPHGTTLIPVPFITVENKECSDSSERFTTDHLSLTDTSEELARTQNVTVLTCNNWNLGEDAEPPSPETLVALWLASERVSRVEGPTLVLCHDGVTGCGLYMALSVLLERMTVERECDVILAVRVVRRSRAEFVFSKAQFEYLYDAAVHFAESFETYSNFA